MNKRKVDRKKALEAGLPEQISTEPSPVQEAEADKVTDLDNVASIAGLPGHDILSLNELEAPSQAVHFSLMRSLAMIGMQNGEY